MSKHVKKLRGGKGRPVAGRAACSPDGAARKPLHRRAVSSAPHSSQLEKKEQETLVEAVRFIVKESDCFLASSMRPSGFWDDPEDEQRYYAMRDLKDRLKQIIRARGKK